VVKYLVQSIQLLFSVSSLRLGKNFTKANQLSVDSDYVYCDYREFNF